MNLEQILLGLKARYKIVLLTLFLTVCAALAATLFAKKIYTASAAVVIDVKFADPISGSVLAAWTQPSFIPTQLDIITSDRVADTVVRVLKLDQQPGVEEKWQEQTGGRGEIRAWVAGQLKANLDAKPSKDSTVITINFKGQDPKLATDVANAFAQAYIDTNVDLRREPARQYEKYFVQQAQAARDRLEKAQAALSSFQQRNQLIMVSDDRFDVETTRLTQLSSQLLEIVGQSAESQSHETAAKANSASISEVLQSPIIQSLKQDLARQEAKLQELSGNLGANNPRLQRAQAEVTSLRQKVASESALIASGVSTNNRVNAQRKAQISAALEAQKARVLKLKQDRDAAAVLQRDVDSAKTAYDAVATRVTQSNLESQSNQTNIAILNPAVEPLRPSSPKPLLNMGIALLLGLMLGVGAALLLEQRDRRVRSIDDLSRVLGLPVMGVIGGNRRSLSFGFPQGLISNSPKDSLRLPNPGAA